MKKLSVCALLGGALFALGGTAALVELASRRFGTLFLFFPLAWDLVMVALGLCIVLRCECARRAAVAWGIFCVFASLLVGVAAFDWLLPQQSEPPGVHRMIFMILSVGFGVIFGIWQLVAFKSPELRSWAGPGHDPAESHHG
ncbi:MAG TPA: hypothetical protein VHE13_15415 [Opitutus sp.]|nr:hypothetical protein [Opitutus sp.]